MIGQFFQKHVQPTLQWFKQAVTEPRHQLDRTERFVRYSYELGVHGYKALRRDNAPQMAAALSFRMLFALLPVLVVSAVFTKGLRGPDEFINLAHRIIDGFGLYNQYPTSLSGEPTTGVSFGSSLEDLVRKISSIDLSALGWVGLLVVVYSAIGLMVTIENSFNAIYGAPEGRSWVRRVPMYWLVLTLGPLFIGVTAWMGRQFGQFFVQ